MKVGNVSQSLINRVYSEDNKARNGGFAGILKGMINDVDNMQKVSSALTSAAISGKNVEVHDVMIAGEKGKLAFDLMLEVRNKLIESYQELMRMNM